MRIYDVSIGDRTSTCYKNMSYRISNVSDIEVRVDRREVRPRGDSRIIMIMRAESMLSRVAIRSHNTIELA